MEEELGLAQMVGNRPTGQYGVKEIVAMLMQGVDPEDLIEAIKSGCDLFDCVAPTRMARNGALHTKKGRMNISNAQFKDDFGPIEKGCECYTCKNYTRAYLCHLFKSNELSAFTLATIHNIHFMIQLMSDYRKKILHDEI